MNKFLGLALCLWSTLLLADPRINIATFDSGFGGYFTAKEIEAQTNELLKTHAGTISITHYGDTANAPYGAKTPAEIAAYSAKGIARAFSDGAEVVFIACNTASTQFTAIQALLNKNKPGQGARIVSIIDSSVVELKKRIDAGLESKSDVSVAILATPATIKNGAYIQALARAYGVEATSAPLQSFTQKRWMKAKGDEVVSVSTSSTLRLKNGKVVSIAQLGPANWVEMIEHGASLDEKRSAIARDLALLSPKSSWDVVGEFCTHFPAIDDLIKTESARLQLSTPATSYIKQGPLMAQLFRAMISPRLTPSARPAPMKVRAKIYISGNNLEETKGLAQEIFPTDPVPQVQRISF